MASRFRERPGVNSTSTSEARPLKYKAQDQPLLAENVSRALRLLQTEVSFIHSAEFELDDAVYLILNVAEPELTVSSRRQSPPSSVPSHLTHLWEVSLLKPEEELLLFRRMNFLRYRANALRSRLNPHKPKVALMDQIEQHLSDALSARSHIVRANLRLVVSIARKFVNDATTLDELISDGHLIIMKAVDRFDYGRGFRFSTYATHAVQREFYRQYKTGQRRRVMEVATDPEILFHSVVSPEDSRDQVHQDRQVTYLKNIMSQCLDAREAEIVDMRFGLNSESGGQTLREVGERLNISKERVRQIQTRAIEQIREVARFKIHDADL